MRKLLQSDPPDAASSKPVRPAGPGVQENVDRRGSVAKDHEMVRGSKPVCCILGASFASRNLGVSALASGTVASILSAYPEARIFLLDYGKSPTVYPVKHSRGIAEVELVNMRFSWKPHLRNNIARLLAAALLLRLVPSKKLRENLIARHPYLSRVQAADVIVSLAGGDSFSDIYGMRRLFYVALPQLLVLLMNRPLVLLPQTLGPFKGRLAKSLGGFIMRQARRVYARDRESLEEVRPLMRRNESRLDFSYDMAFLLKPIPPQSKPSWLELVADKPLVGLNVSGLLYHGGYTRDNMFGLKADYQELVRKIIDYFIRQKNARVVLVPHVFGSPGDLDSDPAASAAIFQELQHQFAGQLHLLADEYDQHEIKYLIGRCDFFLGSRMHACIAALSQGVPAIGLAYSKKFLGVLRTIGAEDMVLDLRECDAQRVIQRIEGIYAAREKIRADLAARMPTVEQTVAGLFPQIVALENASGG